MVELEQDHKLILKMILLKYYLKLSMTIFGDVKQKIICYMCGNNNSKMTNCTKCKKIICYSCKDCVFIGPKKICFWCQKEYINKK